MTPALSPFPDAPALPSQRRLAWGLGLSVLAHLALIVAVRPMTAAYLPVTPLQVEIRDLVTEPAAPLAGEAPSDIPAPSALASPATAAPLTPTAPGAVPDPRLDPRLPLERYFTSSEVDVRAEPLNEVDLVYPLRAYQSRIRGKVTLRLLINERGVLDDVIVLQAEPRGVFEDAALTATRALQFSPARRLGRSVKSQKTIEVDFDPYENINKP